MTTTTTTMMMMMMMTNYDYFPRCRMTADSDCVLCSVSGAAVQQNDTTAWVHRLLSPDGKLGRRGNPCS